MAARERKASGLCRYGGSGSRLSESRSEIRARISAKHDRRRWAGLVRPQEQIAAGARARTQAGDHSIAPDPLNFFSRKGLD